MTCPICNSEVDTLSRDSIRFSNTQPPVSSRSIFASSITAMADSFTAVIRAAMNEPEETFWFHRKCWVNFKDLLTN